MKLEYLSYFLDIVNTGSMNRTAENFYTSHQVIRNAIANLENELQVALITTTNQGSRLTPAGEIVASHGQQLLDDFAALNDALQPHRKPIVLAQTCPIHLCITPYLSDSILLNFVSDYQRNNVLVRIDLRSTPLSELLPYVRDTSTVCLTESNEDNWCLEQMQEETARQGLNCTLLATRQLFLCALSKSKWAKMAYISRNDMRQIPLVFKYTALAAGVDKPDDTAAYQFVNSFESQKRMIKMQNGVGIVTRTEFDYYFKSDGNFTLIPGELADMQYACITKGCELPAYMQDFIKALQKIF